MDNEREMQKDLIKTTDCLEAVGVFKGWKNFLFAIILICILLLQVPFWLIDRDVLGSDSQVQSETETITIEPPLEVVAPEIEVADEAGQIEQTAKQIIADVNQPVPVEEKVEESKINLSAFLKVSHLSWTIRFVNFLLIPTAALYCLTMLFSLKVSMLGRLGGINHIARAFFISLVMFVLILPWQLLFTDVIFGATYRPSELLNYHASIGDAGIFTTILYYLRFAGYWIVVLLLLIFSQLRSIRWAKATLRRLEII